MIHENHILLQEVPSARSQIPPKTILEESAFDAIQLDDDDIALASVGGLSGVAIILNLVAGLAYIRKKFKKRNAEGGHETSLESDEEIISLNEENCMILKSLQDDQKKISKILKGLEQKHGV